MTPRAHSSRARRCTGISAAVDRICDALADEPPERWLSSLSTTASYVIRCAEPEDRMGLVDRWCELIREQVTAGIREDAH